MSEIYSKLTTKTPERRLRPRPSVFIESNMVISDDQKIASVFIECVDTIVPNTIVPK